MSHSNQLIETLDVRTYTTLRLPTSNGSPEPEPEDCSNKSLNDSSCGMNASPSESHFDDVFRFTLHETVL